MPETLATPLTVSGTGLITGLPVTVGIEPALPGHGVVFYLEGDLPIPARFESVVHMERGVTLGHPSGKTLSIVEHFLCACALAGQLDLTVRVLGAPELPILDGSAQPWLEQLRQAFGQKPSPSGLDLKQGVFYRYSDEILLYALPASHLQISYGVHFPHPDLQHRWVRWDSQTDGAKALSPARTFGMVRDLPILQAQGLAKGVSLENTLGLNDDGTYTTPLRLEDEPIRHKILDLLGDLTLSGLNPLQLNAHIYALNAGHESHIGFAKKLRKALLA